MKNDKQVIILLGPPGSGKGTQGTLLAEKLGLYYFETSKLLEKSFNQAKPGDFVEVQGEKYFLEKEKELWSKGVLCSPTLVSFLVQKEIKALAEQDENLLLSGSPRTLLEGQELMPLLEELYGKENIKIILMEVSPEQTVLRNSNRRICELMRHPILNLEETKNLTKCPLDGSNLIKRAGLDDPESIKVRIREYQERTLPLVEFLQANNFQVCRVNGEGSVVEVFQRNIKVLQ